MSQIQADLGSVEGATGIGSIESPHPHSLHQAFADVDLLIHQAMRQKIDVPTDLIGEIESTRSNYGPLTNDPAQRTKFLAAFSALSNLLYPVTVDSLRTFGPRTKILGFSFPFQRAAVHLMLVWLWTTAVFFFLAILTVLWANDTVLIAQVTSARTDLVATQAAVDEAGAAASDLSKKRYASAQAAFGAASQALSKNFVGFAKGDDNPSAQDPNLAFEIAARAAVKTQESSILPLLFGALGACVQSLRRMSIKINERTYRATDVWTENVRMTTGAVFGIVISYLISPEEILGIGKSLTPFGLAFIAGYSSELLLVALDRVIWSGRNSMKPRENQEKSANTPPRR